MIKEHKYVANDISDDLIIWKYFKFEYFLWMMLYKCLYFCKADQFEDKNEFHVNEILAKLYRQNIEDLQKDIDRAKARSFVSCWHISEHESLLMWKAYSDIHNGIVVKTTVGKLKESYKGPLPITIGKVDYIDKDSAAQPLGEALNFLKIVFSKIKEFEAESELRFYEDIDKKFNDNFSIPIDLKTLISEIRVAPKTTSNIYKLVKDLAQSNGLRCSSVKMSELELR